MQTTWFLWGEMFVNCIELYTWGSSVAENSLLLLIKILTFLKMSMLDWLS